VSVSGVQDGLTLFARLGPGATDMIKTLLLSVDTVALAAGQVFSWNDGAGASAYDFDLSHHAALRQQPGESFESWAARVFASREFAYGYPYMAEADLSPTMQRRFNAGGFRGYANTKYLAVTSSRTMPLLGDQVPAVGMTALMVPFALPTGHLDGVCDYWDTTICLSQADEENDGLVPRSMQRGPHNGPLIPGTTDPMPMMTKTVCDRHCLFPLGALCCASHVEKDWTSMVGGQWYFVEVEYDHMQTIGFQQTEVTMLLDTPVTDVWASEVVPFINSL